MVLAMQTDQPITKLIEFLKAVYGDDFHAYYDGDPDDIPKVNLPCVIVVKNSDEMSNGPTGMQRIREELVVKIVFNKEDDWSPEVDATQLTEKRIRDMVEAGTVRLTVDPTLALLVAGRGDPAFEGDRERIERWLPPHCPSCLTSAGGV